MKKVTQFIEMYKRMSEPAKASFWYTVCNVIQKGIALFATPIFTRIMSQAEYGKYTIFQSWYNIVVIFCTLNLFQACYGKGLIQNEEKEDEFTSSLLSLTLLITTIMIGVYILNIDFWTTVFSLSPVLMLLMFVEIIAMTATGFWAEKERFKFRYKKYIILVLLTSILSLVFGFFAVTSSEQKVFARVFSDVFAKCLFGFPILILIFSRGKMFYNAKYWKFALSFNLPLIPHFLSTYVLNQADRVMISKMVGDSQAAIYGIAYTISMMMFLIVNAINNSLTPYIYRKIKDLDFKSIYKNTRYLFVFISLLSVLTMFFGPEIIYIFAGPEYAEAIWIIPPVSASLYFIFVYSVISNVEYYNQKTTYVATVSCVCAVINVILNYVCIKKFGYFAAGYTTLVCYILFAILHYIAYKKITNENIFDLKIIILFSFVTLLFMLVSLILYNFLVIRYALALALLIIVIIILKNKMGFMSK